MAQVSIPPSQAMARRAPLSNLPNAVNSPYQMTTSIKRSRSVQRDVSYGQPPPKKQAVEAISQLRTPVRRPQQLIDTSKVVPPKRATARTRPAIGGPPAFADIGQQARKPTVSRSITETAAVEQQNDDIRAWQKHYRKAFPSFVFFFESIPHDVLLKAQRQVLSLGATYEKYFSTKVTHLITNRTLPNDALQRSSAATAVRWNSRTTVNPALIDQRTEARKGGRGSTDILLKAREYGMKIWATEKLDRVLNGLFDYPPGRQALTVTHSRDQTARTHHANAQQNDLSHLLRNERLHGPTDRDPTVAAKDLHFWKGPYIYIHDMFGTSRPIILREYPKVQRREDGTWPQFRSVSGGKCPFIEEHVHQRREKDRTGRGEKAEQTRQRGNGRATVATRLHQKETRTDMLTGVEQRHKQPAKDSVASKERSPARGRANIGKNKRILAEANALTDHRINSRASVPETALGGSRRVALHLENAIAFTATNESTSQTARRYNVEPAASGVQPSNITSAIRSQMISSHQDQPGQRAGTSKEMHALHRKVAGNVLLGNRISKPVSMARRSTDLLSKPPASGVGLSRKRTADGCEVLVKVVEEAGQIASKNTVAVAEPKPGYCENCREKFDDFEEHTLSRQHRKFATNNKNWETLDDLLRQLRRPTKGSSQYI